MKLLLYVYIKQFIVQFNYLSLSSTPPKYNPFLLPPYTLQTAISTKKILSETKTLAIIYTAAIKSQQQQQLPDAIGLSAQAGDVSRVL